MQQRKKLALTMGVAIVIAAAAGVYFQWSDAFFPTTQSKSARRAAPRFELKDASDKTRRLEEFRGKPVMIHFWASWCPPCLGELPRWVELVTYFKGKDIQFLAISLDESWENAEKVMPSSKLVDGLVSLLDPNQKVPDAFGTYQYPETYLLDREHRVVEKWVGPQNWESEKIRGSIDRTTAIQ